MSAYLLVTLAGLPLGFLENLGGGEMIIIAILALVLFGERLPNVARSFGKGISEFKRSMNEAQSEFKQEMDRAADMSKKPNPTDPAISNDPNNPNNPGTGTGAAVAALPHATSTENGQPITDPHAQFKPPAEGVAHGEIPLEWTEHGHGDSGMPNSSATKEGAPAHEPQHAEELAASAAHADDHGTPAASDPAASAPSEAVKPSTADIAAAVIPAKPSAGDPLHN